jgi:hypothetical protein
VFSADGVKDLEMASRGWASSDYLRWLEEGFQALQRSSSGSVEEMTAFAPLRFHRDQSVLGQLLAFFSVCADNQPRLHESIRRALEDHLRLQIGTSTSDEELELITDLWRTYSALGATPETVPLARLWTRELSLEDPSPSMISLVDVVVSAVAAAPVTSSQISFFEDLHDQRATLWRDDYALFLVDRYFDWRGGNQQEAWTELLIQFGEAIDRLADPERPIGRAFIARMTKRLLPDVEISRPLRVVEARALAERLLDPSKVAPPADRETRMGYQLAARPRGLDAYVWQQPLLPSAVLAIGLSA